MSLLSIVIPVYNEKDNLPLIYNEIVSVMKAIAMAFEIIFVDDGSTDESILIIKELAQRDQRVKFLSLSRNFGQQATITAGLDHASGDAVITMDCDLQDPPSLIPELIAR